MEGRACKGCRSGSCIGRSPTIATLGRPGRRWNLTRMASSLSVRNRFRSSIVVVVSVPTLRPSIRWLCARDGRIRGRLQRRRRTGGVIKRPFRLSHVVL
jgi:hypothetical protein